VEEGVGGREGEGEREKYNKNKSNKDDRLTETVGGILCGFQEITDSTVM
jgi:hypothetical protein